MRCLALPPHPPLRLQGIALVIVLVLVLLSMLLALWTSRSALLHEMVVGNDADYQRALEAAHALLQDAEHDIRGEQAGGTLCEPDRSRPSACRNGANIAKIPERAWDVAPLLSRLDEAAPTQCRDALCTRRIGPQDFWNNTDEARGITLDQMIATGVGARYGDFTGATADSRGNPILASRDAARGGWYWIEVMPYDPSAGNSGLIDHVAPQLAFHMEPQVAYRITALARGLRNSTRVVLQQTYVRQRRRD